MDEAKEYLAGMLDEAFPHVDKICDSMKINFITMDVTWETLNSQNFVDWLSKQFPVNKELKKPFDEYRAARQRISATSSVLTRTALNPRSAEVWRQTGQEREFRASAGVSQCGGLCAKPGVIW